MASEYTYSRFVLSSLWPGLECWNCEHRCNRFNFSSNQWRKGIYAWCKNCVGEKRRRRQRGSRRRRRRRRQGTPVRVMPDWGNLTKKRSKLMTEMRIFWKNKWDMRPMISEIKKVILETTPLPEDVVNLLLEYFEYPYCIYPYQTKAPPLT